MTASRRLFLQGVAALVASTAAPPALARGRLPYVEAGAWVDSLVWHMWDRPAAPFGPMLVHEIDPWDGTGYPIILAKCGWRTEDREHFAGWYDFEWSDLRRDVPKDFWHHHTTDQYPNVHAYVREQRFGESPEIMRMTMERNMLTGPPLGRQSVQPVT